MDTPEIINETLNRPEKKICLPACKMQENKAEMSSVQYPPIEGFFIQPEFCHVASHILQVSCANSSRRYFLEKKNPNICNVLSDFEDYFGEDHDNCDSWPAVWFENNSQENQSLTDEVTKYGRENLALVHIFFQSPYITKMKRDLEITLTDFIANTGGLLGLYLGFSFVSLFEIFYWCCNCLTVKTKTISVISRDRIIPIK